jgi:hypothetical protein
MLRFFCIVERSIGYLLPGLEGALTIKLCLFVCNAGR